MGGVKSASIDLVLADLPYGITQNKWDSVIPIKPLMEQYQRIIKPHGAVLLFGMGKFGAELITKAPKQMPYRYEWIWRKTMPVGFLNSHHMPLRAHENIYVFYKHLPTYHPQMRQGFKPYKGNEKGNRNNGQNYQQANRNYKRFDSKHGERFPIDIVTFNNDLEGHRNAPTEKPARKNVLAINLHKSK